jgi:hypothetical protein
MKLDRLQKAELVVMFIILALIAAYQIGGLLVPETLASAFDGDVCWFAIYNTSDISHIGIEVPVYNHTYMSACNASDPSRGMCLKGDCERLEDVCTRGRAVVEDRLLCTWYNTSKTCECYA